LGVWQPVRVSDASMPGDERGLGSPPTGLAERSGDPRLHFDQAPARPPSPPLRARTAFLLATFALLVGLLGSVATERRLVSDFRRALSARLPRAHLPSGRANRARSQTIRPRPRQTPHAMHVISALAVLPGRFSQTGRRALALALASLRSRARPSFRLPRGVMAFQMGRYREQVTVSLVAVALGVAAGCLVVLLAG